MASDLGLSLVNSRPYAFRFPPATTALILIDMQRDFVDNDGFGSIQCGDAEIFASVRSIVPTVQKVLEISRSIGMQIIHTREGHRPDLSDLPSSKQVRQVSAPNGHHILGIGDKGPMGRLLVRGEWGHDIIDELAPRPGEIIVDKPGKGSFYGTGLHRSLLSRGITHLIFSGVTTECCVTTTLRECNDRGFECCILSDCTGGFDQQMVTTSLDIVCGQDGLFGFIGHSSDFFATISESHYLTPPSTPPTSDDLLLSPEILQHQYASGLSDPESVINMVFTRIEEYDAIDPAVWISRQRREDVLLAAKALILKFDHMPKPPLYGIPFGVKDNIDFEGVLTTAGCEKYAYLANSTAPAVKHLLDAGALFIGKLNMDQLATGLSGCRSPFGTLHSVYSKRHISGGSSSGSAVAVAAKLVSFSLGTDTAGSGRIPAAFNGIVGLKPTKGTVSARGVVPACRTLDTLSIFAPTIADARKVWLTIDQYDRLDSYAKPPGSLPVWSSDFRGPRAGGFKFGIPPQDVLETCSGAYQACFQDAIEGLKSCGGKLVEIDYSPFSGASNLIYGASLVNERIASIGFDFLHENLDSLHPATRDLFEKALSSNTKAWSVYQDQALQAEYTRKAHRVFDTLEGGIDVLIVPTAPLHPTIKEMEKDPLQLNAKVGMFTHAANVLDLCGVGVNAGWVVEDEIKLPFGVTFLGGSGRDGRILDIAAVFEKFVRDTTKP